MSIHKQWNIIVTIDEKPVERATAARAQLSCDDGQLYTGVGLAKRFERDDDVPGIGDDLAAARALSDLATQLTADAYAEIDHTIGWQSDDS